MPNRDCLSCVVVMNMHVTARKGQHIPSLCLTEDCLRWPASAWQIYRYTRCFRPLSVSTSITQNQLLQLRIVSLQILGRTDLPCLIALQPKLPFLRPSATVRLQSQPYPAVRAAGPRINDG